MKLSCLPVSLYPEFAAGRLSLEDWFRAAATLGLDGADISVAHVERTPASLARLRHAASDAGVAIVMLVTYTDFTHADRQYRAAQVDDLRAWIEAGELLGVRFMRLTAGQAHADVPEEDGLRWAAEGLTACLRDAEAAGIRLLFENHTRGAVWTSNDFTHPARRFLDVVARTEGQPLEILFDTANALVLHDDPAALLQAVLHRLGAVHLSDIRSAGAFEPVVIGTGAAPLERLLRIVTASGFDRWVSIEEGSRTGDDGFRRAVAYADALWVRAGGRPRVRGG